MASNKDKCFLDLLTDDELVSLATASRISVASAKELIRILKEESSRGCTFKGGIRVSVAKRMTAEHSKEKDFSRYVEFVSAVLRTKKDKANSRPKKQQVAIENTSKAIQLELFPFNVAFPWFKPYMDQS